MLYIPASPLSNPLWAAFYLAMRDERERRKREIEHPLSWWMRVNTHIYLAFVAGERACDVFVRSWRAQHVRAWRTRLRSATRTHGTHPAPANYFIRVPLWQISCSPRIYARYAEWICVAAYWEPIDNSIPSCLEFRRELFGALISPLPQISF